MKQILLEALFVSTVGAAVAFAANQLSPRGLALTRNYFPEASGTAGPGPAPANVPGANIASPLDLLKGRLREAGLQLATTDDVKRLFGDPRRSRKRPTVHLGCNGL